ncbi:uncharacterized protein LOC144621797 [Crassostrea virginica]
MDDTYCTWEPNKDTLLDFIASDNTPRNEDADGAHTKDPPMDDTAHGSPTRIHCWTTQLLTTHPGMRIQMEHTLRIQRWMTLHMGVQEGSTAGLRSFRQHTHE